VHSPGHGGSSSHLTREEWEQRKRFVAFSVRDEQALVALQAAAQLASPQVIEQLYAWVTQFAEVAAFFPDEATLRRAKQAQSVYFDQLMAGRYGEEYMRGRIQVGETHARLGVTTQWYLGMYAYYASLIIPHIVRACAGDAERTITSLQAFIKLLLLDTDLTLHTYTARRERDIEQRNQRLADKERALTEGRLRQAEEVSAAMAEAARVLANMASGDLTSEMRGSYTGDLATLCDQLERSQETLRGLVTQIREASINVAQASREISHASFDLSRRTEAQAANLEQAAATAEELTATVRHNAQNAQRVAKMASENRKEANRGAAAVQRTIEAMGAIKESSGRIADIIGTVDEIAFQTNILALNAAQPGPA
jgi:methyl-accepting chemotaxis protein